MVSNVIELSHDGPPDLEFMETAPGRINVGLSHGASNLNGYEVVVKQLVDPEYNEWKDLETTTIWHTSGIAMINLTDEIYTQVSVIPYTTKKFLNSLLRSFRGRLGAGLVLSELDSEKEKTFDGLAFQH